MNVKPQFRSRVAFTLIELLVVVSIISLLISILMPSLSRARDQAKSVHCLARLKDYGNALAAYENTSGDLLPPAMWTKANPADLTGDPLATYGWAETLFEFVYKESVYLPGHTLEHFPVQRNFESERWEDYFICKASAEKGVNAGHYRVYLPSWSVSSYSIEDDGKFGNPDKPNPWTSSSRTSIRPKLPLVADSNDRSFRGNSTDPEVIGSHIGAGEANEAGPNGFDGNRFSDRHYGGTNYLFADFHAEWRPKFREKLARDWDLNGVTDIEVVP